MRYDFDIHYLIPKEVTADPKIAGLLSDTGFNLEGQGNYVAMFRDPETCRALAGASQDVQDYFTSSGFSLQASGRTFQHGVYEAANTAQFLDICGRLAAQAKRHDLSRARWNGFVLQDFYKHAVAMQGVRVGGHAPQAAHRASAPESEDWRPAPRTLRTKPKRSVLKMIGTAIVAVWVLSFASSLLSVLDGSIGGVAGGALVAMETSTK